MSARQVIRRVLSLYAGNVRGLLILALIVFIPVGLAEAVPVVVEVNHQPPLEVIGRLAWFGAEEATILFGVTFYSGTIGTLVDVEEGGRRESLPEILRRLPYRTLAAIDLMVSLGTTILAVLLIVPGLLFLAYHSLAAPLAESGELRAREAMRESRRLVRGDLRLVFGLVVPIFLAYVVIASFAKLGSAGVIGEGILADWLAATVVLIATSPFAALTAVVLAHGLSEQAAPKPVTVRAGR